jgi:hypothetical protein
MRKRNSCKYARMPSARNKAWNREEQTASAVHYYD